MNMYLLIKDSFAPNIFSVSKRFDLHQEFDLIAKLYNCLFYFAKYSTKLLITNEKIQDNMYLYQCDFKKFLILEFFGNYLIYIYF